jgi:ribosomal protein L11 methyltransferase
MKVEMSQTSYFQLDIHNLARADEEVVSYLLFEMGAAGVQENLQFEQKDRFFSPEVLTSDFLDLRAYFETPPAPEDIQAFAQRFPAAQVKISEQENQDWLSLWKASWRPFLLCPDVWVVPPWLSDEFQVPAGARQLLIEPGMAFGTGTHPTTQLAAQLLKQHAERVGVQTLLDVGTGSGILAILARELGVQEVLAYDNDPEAARVVRENCQLNQIANFPWVENWSRSLVGQVDLTVANIIDGVLLDLKDEFRGLASPYYLFTGILEEREANFLAQMTTGWPIKILRRLQQGEWVGFLFEGSP